MRCWLSFRCVRQATALYIWGLTPGVCPLVLSPVSSVPDVIHDHNDVGAQRALGVWASDSRLLLCTMFSMCIISIFVKISVGRKPVWGTFCLIRLWISSQLLSKECLSCTSRQNSKFCESRVYFLLYFLVPPHPPVGMNVELPGVFSNYLLNGWLCIFLFFKDESFHNVPQPLW